MSKGEEVNVQRRVCFHLQKRVKIMVLLAAGRAERDGTFANLEDPRLQELRNQRCTSFAVAQIIHKNCRWGLGDVGRSELVLAPSDTSHHRYIVCSCILVFFRISYR
jgi:hypothetical protein